MVRPKWLILHRSWQGRKILVSCSKWLQFMYVVLEYSKKSVAHLLYSFLQLEFLSRLIFLAFLSWSIGQEIKLWARGLEIKRIRTSLISFSHHLWQIVLMSTWKLSSHLRGCAYFPFWRVVQRIEMLVLLISESVHYLGETGKHGLKIKLYWRPRLLWVVANFQHRYS